MDMDRAPRPAEDVFTAVRRIIAEELDVDPAAVTAETDLVRDLGASSITIVMLVMKIEAHFGIDAGAEEIRRLVVVKNAVDFIAERVAERGRGAGPGSRQGGGTER